MRKWMLAVLILLAVSVAFALKTLWDAGEFKSLQTRRPGPCRAVEGVWSSEDITIDRDSGLALISAADRRQGRPGAIFAYDLRQSEPELINLTEEIDLELHPHGISLYQNESGPDSLFVVNHSGQGSVVEVFDFQGGRLTHRDTITSDLMHSPNDVLATGPRSFYVTLDHGSRSNWGKVLEEYLQLARSSVLYYNGTRFEVAATGLAYANGLAVNQAGNRIFVGASVGRGVWVYGRSAGQAVLKPQFVIDLGTGVDNLEMDADDNLWVAAHPRLLTFTQYAADPEVSSPSEVLKVSFFMERDYEVEQVFSDGGELIAGSSVAAAYQGQLLIGSVYDPRFLVCQLKEN